MNHFIYEKPNSLSKKNCEKIMELFEKETNTKYEGVTQGGLNKSVKNTTDYVIDKTDNNWSDIYNVLSLELQTNIKLYINSLYENSFDDKYKYFENNKLTTENFMVQRYIKKHGKYIYHHDFSKKNNTHRVITFLWYLNTIEEGGETEFWGNYTIKPEQGKLIFFPALWCYPHCGNIPLSDNKYIITGWLYEDYQVITTIHDKYIQRYMYNTFFTKTDCEWIVEEIEKYYKTSNNQLNYISFELIHTLFNFILIKMKMLINNIKEFYCLTDTTNLNIKQIHFIKNDNTTTNDNKNTDVFNFYIPLCENMDFFMNDNTTKNILVGDLFLFTEKNVNYKSNTKYYLYGFIEYN